MEMLPWALAGPAAQVFAPGVYHTVVWRYVPDSPHVARILPSFARLAARFCRSFPAGIEAFAV
jgi:hypothetical protein